MTWRGNILGHFFDRETGRTWKWALPDPPPPHILIPEWDGEVELRPGDADPVSEQMVEVHFYRLYFVAKALDGQPHVVYASERGTRGARTI